MRKKEREITDKAVLEQLLMQTQICRLGLYDGKWPYVVPVNMGYEPGRIYFHSSKKGKKMDILRDNPNVCFELDADVEIVTGDKPCDWTTYYKSIIGFGTAVILDDEEEKLAGLKVIMRRHGGPDVRQGRSRQVLEFACTEASPQAIRLIGGARSLRLAAQATGPTRPGPRFRRYTPA